MSRSVCAWYHEEWAALKLEDYGDFSDKTTDCNQIEYGDHTVGAWYYIADTPLADGSMVIYHGTWGNDSSPGASTYTYAEIYDMSDPDDAAEFEAQKRSWESQPEWEEVEDEEEFEEEDDYEEDDEGDDEDDEEDE